MGEQVKTIDNKERVNQIIAILEREYPDARTALSFYTSRRVN